MGELTQIDAALDALNTKYEEEMHSLRNFRSLLPIDMEITSIMTDDDAVKYLELLQQRNVMLYG